jgi:hypothetical protein
VWVLVGCALGAWASARWLVLPLLGAAIAPRVLTPGFAADLTAVCILSGVVFPAATFRYVNWRRSRQPDTTLQERELAFLTSLGHSKKPVQ